MYRALCIIVLIVARFPTCKLDVQGCPTGCKCSVEQIGEKISVSCDTIAPSSMLDYSPFPTILPNNTRAFFFRVADKSHIFDESVISFADITWGQIEEITLQGVHYLKLNKTRLAGLATLKILRLKDETLANILHPDAFVMTTNIEVLDLSYNPWLSFETVVAALNESLPNLKYLDLCNIQAKFSAQFTLTKEFAMAIKNKPLITINVSNSKISYIDVGFTSESIRYINISNTYSLWFPYSANTILLPNIEEIDISGSAIIVKQTVLQTFEKKWGCFPITSSIKRIIANNILTNGPIYLHDYRLQLECNTTRVEEIYIRYSNIRKFNVTIDKTLSNLKLLDIEGNSMEYLSPNFMQKIPNLQEIYLARNKLSTMEDLGELFEGNVVLKVVDLSHNALEVIPWSMFTRTQMLEILRLQGNMLPVLHFSVEKLLSLKLLDLRNNMIKYVSRDTINVLLSISDHHGRLKINKADENGFAGNEAEIVSQMNRRILISESKTDKLVIDLSGNIMECTCDRIWFNEWMLYTQFSLFDKHLYTCKFDNNLNYMTSELLNDMKYQCKLKEFIGAIIAIPFIIILIIVFAYVIVRRKRISKRKPLPVDTGLMERYDVNDHEDRQRYFVFLSFAGKDVELVNTYIIPELEKFVREKFRNNNLICTGDSHFTPGRWISEEIYRCLTRCDVFVMVVTKHFIKSEWCKYEVMLAKQINKFKILLVNEEVYQHKIPPALNGILRVCTRATWRLQNQALVIRPKWCKIFESMLEASTESLEEEEEGI